jgi:hypothetical protein
MPRLRKWNVVRGIHATCATFLSRKKRRRLATSDNFSSTYSLAAVNFTPIRIAGRLCISIISTMGMIHIILKAFKLADIPTI